MNALVPQEARAIGAVVFTFDEKRQMAECLAQSGLFGVKNATQALALMLVAEAEGEHPASVAQDYDIIQGKGARKTHSVLARFQAMGGKVDWHELSHTRAEATFSHPKGGSLRLDWTIEQARQAGLTGKDNWKSYARAMLRARLIAEGVRAVFPAAIGGWQVPEEAMDPQLDAEPQASPTIKHMGAADVVQPPAATAAPAPAVDNRQVFPDEDFQRGLPVWQKAVNKGLSPGEVLQRAEAVNQDKQFTESQKAKILSLKKADAAPTFAAVADALNKARDADALAVAGDLIGAVADEQQRAELRAIYDQREQALTQGAMQ